MFIKNEHYETMLAIRKYLPQGEAFNILPKEEQDEIIKFEMMLMDFHKEHNARNKKIAGYLAEKRKDDKNYGRTPYVKKSTDMIICVDKHNGIDLYRKVCFDGQHYYIKYKGKNVNVDTDIRQGNFLRKN